MEEMLVGFFGLMLIISIIYLIFYLGALIIGIVSYWFLFKKAGKESWAAVIPYYNMYTLFDIVCGEGIYFLFLFVPIASLVFTIIMYIRLAEVFGKSTAYGIGIVLLPFVFLPMLAFGDSVYQGPKKLFQ